METYAGIQIAHLLFWPFTEAKIEAYGTCSEMCSDKNSITLGLGSAKHTVC